MSSDGDIALNERAAARLVGFSPRRLRAWEAAELVRPAVRRSLSERNIVRLYGFDELLELFVADALLRAGRSSRQIRRVLQHLRSLGYERPLRELIFAVSGQDIFFQHHDGSWEGDREPNQVVISEVLNLEAIRARIREAIAAPAAGDGGVERRRGVLGGKPLIAGTRVPLVAIEPYLRRGASSEDIAEAFPQLRPEDIAAARSAIG